MSVLVCCFVSTNKWTHSTHKSEHDRQWPQKKIATSSTLEWMKVILSFSLFSSAKYFALRMISALSTATTCFAPALWIQQKKSRKMWNVIHKLKVSEWFVSQWWSVCILYRAANMLRIPVPQPTSITIFEPRQI